MVLDRQSGSQTDGQTQDEAWPYIDEALNCSDWDDVEERQGKEGAPHCHKAQLPLPAPPPAKHMVHLHNLCSEICTVLLADHWYNVCKSVSAAAHTSHCVLKMTCATDICDDSYSPLYTVDMKVN